ncbi:MAG: HEAT repeat domain-containing protein [Gemmataceae bacterium]|nr:HEAT repeat domain-containing protein [Gemmataceae bacterium]
MSKRWRRVLFVVVGAPALLFGLLMLDPFFRQLVFGPAPGGVPFVAWQRAFREWDRDDARKVAATGFWRSLQESAVAPPDQGAWRKLPGEDRRAILLSLADDHEEIVRRHVAGHLGGVPGNDEVAIVLKRYSSDSSEAVRRYALVSLQKVSPPNAADVAALVSRLSDRDDTASRLARQGLARLGATEPEAVVPALVEALRSPDAGKRWAALDVLTSIKSPASIPAVAERLADESPEVRKEALRALGFMKAVEELPRIMKALDDQDMWVRDSACYAIRNIGPEAKAAVPRLVRLAQDIVDGIDKPVAKPPVLAALGTMGPEAKEAVPLLVKLRDEREEGDVKTAAEEALALIDPKRFPAKGGKP